MQSRRRSTKQSSFLLQNLHPPSLRAKKYDESKDRWQARVNDDWRFLFSALRTMPTYSRASSAIRNDFRAAKERSVSNTETRNERLDLRLTPSAKRTLETAALAANRSVREFVLESALARAEQTLPDRQRFGLSAGHWRAFQAALAAPHRPSRRLAELLKQPSVFERGGV